MTNAYIGGKEAKDWVMSDMFTAEERKHAQDVYIRVCKDSGFTMSFTDAAHFAARLMKISTMQLWACMGLDIDIMDQIALGKHPVCNPGRIS